MEKKVVVLFLTVMLLVSPLVFAQEQNQIYTGFNRLTDNVKLLFSSGDNKVALALEIREKEVNSAIENLQNNETKSANKNLDNALDKLLVVQKKVSVEQADEVNSSVDNVIDKIEENNLTETFDRYVLEEEKTQLVAELVVEINGTEGQTMTREVVKSENENRKKVIVKIQNENGETEEIEVEGEIRNDTAVWEIVGEINGIDNGIQQWVVKNSYENGTEGNDAERIIVTDVAGSSSEDNEENVKTEEENKVLGENEKDESNYDPSKDEVIKNEVVEGDYAEGTTAEGTNNVDEGPCEEGEAGCAP